MIAVRRSSLLATILVLAASAFAAASDELARAKDLYRSASYDEALIALNQVARETSGATLVETNELRLFCLIALDRKNEARVAIETMVNNDPFYKLSADQASPRVRTMFKDIRQSLLPGIVQREYAAAKTAFDQKDPEAPGQFERVLNLLDDPLLTPTPAFADLRTVVTGFRDLAKARAPKPEPPPAAPSQQIQATPALANVPASNPPVVGNERTAISAERSAPAVYRDGDADVVPPVALKQTLPQWVVPRGTDPGAWQPEGVLEVTIDESGNVANAILRKPFNASYDAQLLKAAREWKYEPARKAGVPVRFVRNVAIRLGGGN
jgi:TonB family protein